LNYYVGISINENENECNEKYSNLMRRSVIVSWKADRVISWSLGHICDKAPSSDDITTCGSTCRRPRDWRYKSQNLTTSQNHVI